MATLMTIGTVLNGQGAVLAAIQRQRHAGLSATSSQYLKSLRHYRKKGIENKPTRLRARKNRCTIEGIYL